MGQELLEVNREVRLKRARDFVELTRIHLQVRRPFGYCAAAQHQRDGP
jgi:hypothetical protein